MCPGRSDLAVGGLTEPLIPDPLSGPRPALLSLLASTRVFANSSHRLIAKVTLGMDSDQIK